MRTILLLVALLVCGYAWSSSLVKIEANSGKQQTKNESRGTENSPIFVHGEITAKKDKEESYNDAEVVKYTGLLALFTFLLFCFTAALWYVTWRLSKDARDNSERQSDEMRQSISEAIRSATAMEAVAEATRNNAILMQDILHKQMRAYLAFDTSACVPQDISTGWKYEVRFFIKNYGHTNAQAINVNSVLAIMALPLPDTVDLTLPVEEQLEAGDISPGQTYFYRACLENIISEEEIAAIRKQDKSGMYLYGTVKYRDVFGGWHYTNFCKICNWDVKDNFLTTNLKRHNDTN